MAVSYAVPGVYFERQPRAPELPFVRTDVAGFIGFEARIWEGERPSRLTGPAFAALLAAVDAARLAAAQAQAIVDDATFPPVDPARAAALAAAAGARAAALALAAAVAAAPETTAAAVAGLAARVRDGADAAEEAADVDSRLAAQAAAAVAEAAARATERDAEALRAAVDSADAASSPVGHEFNVGVASFQLVVEGVRGTIREQAVLRLSADPAAIPLPDGGGMAFTLVAVVQGAALELRVLGLPAVPVAPARPLADDEIAAALTPPPPPVAQQWLRIADVLLERAGSAVRQVAYPSHGVRLTRCDDFNDFLLLMGAPRDDGTVLPHAVRAFFANGGRTCYVTTVQRPGFGDAAGLEAARRDMIGVQGSSEEAATGLERLLLVEDVMVIDVPDLYARHVSAPRSEVLLPAREREACFRDCERFLPGGVPAEAAGVREARDPLYAAPDVVDTQASLLERCFLDQWWRVLLLFTPALELDPSDGLFHGPSLETAREWRTTPGRTRPPLDDILAGDALRASCAALYYPWVLAQERVGAPVLELPPTAFAAGIIARRDLERGPHVAPANETLAAVVGLTRPLYDQQHGELYEPLAINVLRAFPGYGVQLWGSRTLSSDRFLRFLPVRRCLSAIERRVNAALQELVFEPHTPFLWMQVTHVVLGVLMPLFEAGALRGTSPDEAFFVRCDASVNPPEEVDAGRLVCEVGVAIAAPAEFLVFRVGRREGVIEVVE